MTDIECQICTTVQIHNVGISSCSRVSDLHGWYWLPQFRVVKLGSYWCVMKVFGCRDPFGFDFLKFALRSWPTSSSFLTCRQFVFVCHLCDWTILFTLPFTNCNTSIFVFRLSIHWVIYYTFSWFLLQRFESEPSISVACWIPSAIAWDNTNSASSVP